jgi:hypothetical protein
MLLKWNHSSETAVIKQLRAFIKNKNKKKTGLLYICPTFLKKCGLHLDFQGFKPNNLSRAIGDSKRLT